MQIFQAHNCGAFIRKQMLFSFDLFYLLTNTYSEKAIPQMKLNFCHLWKIWFYLYLSSTCTRIQTLKTSKDKHMYCAILYLCLFHNRYLKT